MAENGVSRTYVNHINKCCEALLLMISDFLFINKIFLNNTKYTSND